MSKKSNFYLSIINELKNSTNLQEIQKKLGLKKQNLNYYLRQLKKEGYIYQKDKGWYEVTERSKNMSNHDSVLTKDSVRGHAYVWTVKVPKEIGVSWSNRISILDKKGVHYRLVGAKENTPRIKVLGRKVWLCNDSIRIYDIPKRSYYGSNAVEARKGALNEILLILGVLERKLGVSLNPLDVSFEKEHYALIKNDLAIQHNRNGEVLRVSDGSGEWLLVDDSLGEGGELENVGKKAFDTNIPMSKWWNDKKKHGFITDSVLLERINQVTENQLMFNQNFESHVDAINALSSAVKTLQEEIKKLTTLK